MDNKMFCFQCQETFQNHGCTISGVCGKSPETAALMDELIQQLKILAKIGQYSREKAQFIVQSLFLTVTNSNFDNDRLLKQIEKAKAWTAGKNYLVGVGVLATSDENTRSLRELLIYGLKGIAAYTEHAAVLGYEDDEVYEFFFKALTKTTEEISLDELISLVIEAGNFAVKSMALLDEANISNYGNPEVTKVRTSVRKNPAILVSGHDLRDLHELLDETLYTGVDVYTHGEMLPAHYYCEFKKYSHLYGNYGNSWHKQAREFELFNGPILMTTNCIIPVRESYKERIFTTGLAGYPGVKHIPDRIDGRAKDFSRIIALAKKCPPPVEIEKGEIIGGFAHNQLFAMTDRILEAVKKGKITGFVVAAGCDGRDKQREYYTELAKKLPETTIILTAGCAKYRYNKLNLGSIGDIPRVLDAGQCNDSYSLVLFALKLKEILGVDDVDKLPIKFDIAWYEQKAVAVLLALLSSGFKNIKIGPTFPAFLSEDVKKFLMETFGLKA